jgi:hypothetical protein
VKVRRGVKVNPTTIAALVRDTCLRILPGRPTWNGMTVYPVTVLVAGFVLLRCSQRGCEKRSAVSSGTNSSRVVMPEKSGISKASCQG